MKNSIALIIALSGFQLTAQENFTRKDSLQGGLRIERTCYDVQHYGLDITINIDKKTIAGFNDIDFKVVENTNKIQVDLFENMKVDSIICDKKTLRYKREFNAVFIDFPNTLPKDSEHSLRFYYSGTPLTAKRAPWDGGFVWKRDDFGHSWVGVAVQGTGASLWFPVKDSQTDEPDHGATIKVAVPNGVMNISNGKLTGSEDLKNGYTRWDWEVKNPINNYDITVNIGDYINLHDSYNALDLDYYVLRYNKEKAERQFFEEVKPMLDCFQSKFGKYPFPEDGYKLVETPYLGMEHQSAVAYGNNYLKGYLGTDISGTGIGLLFDYIIVHESGHEWFGNSITSKDIADMWIHEGFTMYAEAVYVECRFGREKATQYLNRLKSNIENDRPVIGKSGLNNEGSGDMYYKGALLLNTIRSVINDDAKWWAILLKYAETFRHQIIDTKEVVTFFNTESGINLTPIFDQYLRTVKIPFLSLAVNNGKLAYKWENANPDFNMPVDIEINSQKIRLFPTAKAQFYHSGKAKRSDIKVLQDHFLINVK